MVTDYLKQCTYKINGLKNHLYLIIGSENIIIDKDAQQSIYYAEAVSATSTFISGYNISYQEETSLDERYRFDKTLSITIDGLADKITGDIYAVVETEDGTKYLVNPDMPLHFSYEFVLSNNQHQTTLTFRTPSNMPTLQYIGDLDKNVICNKYQLNGIDELYLIEKEYGLYNSTTDSLLLTDDLRKVEYNRNSATLRETFDGETITDTITFDISLDNYKTSWQYRLLEFKENLYRAVVFSKAPYKYYVGFNNGLQPLYQTSDDTITITLTEASQNGCIKKYDEAHNIDTSKEWEFVSELDGRTLWVCNAAPMGCGWAEYVAQIETDAFGNFTGNIKLIKEFYDYFFDEHEYDDEYYEEWRWLLNYNVVGYIVNVWPNGFFPTSECACLNPGEKCFITTNMPSIIRFNGSGSTSFSFNASCDWRANIENTSISVSPSSGNADTEYTITITNASNAQLIDTLEIGCCLSTYRFTVQVDDYIDCLQPQTINIDCNPQTVEIRPNDGCSISNVQVPAGLSYMIVGGNILSVYVPKNEASSSRTFTITADCCSSSATVQIIQDKQYSDWVEDGFVCEYGSKYINERLYTGTTADNLIPTDEYRKGTFVEGNSPDCRSIEKYEVVGYICLNEGDKYEILNKFISYDDGLTWIQTDIYILGEFVESESEFCEQNVEYKWVLTDEWACIDD